MIQLVSPPIMSKTHISEDVLSDLLLLQQAKEVKDRFLPQFKWNLSLSLASLNVENHIAEIVLALFKEGVRIWETESFYSVINLLEILAHIGGENDVPNEDLAALIAIWFELQRLNAWVFGDDADWIDDHLPKLDAAAIGQVVETFLDKVNANLFPIETDVLDFLDIGTMLWAVREVPIYPLGFSLDPEMDSPTSYAEPIQTVFTLVGYEYGIEDEDRLYWDEPINIQIAKIPVSDLAESILGMKSLPETIRIGLSHLIDMLTSNTGNNWLDISYADLAQGQVQVEPWHPSTIDFYKEHWQEAKPIYNSIHDLVEWVKLDEKVRMQQIHRVLIAARIMKDNQQK